jgi:hypothetical protein
MVGVVHGAAADKLHHGTALMILFDAARAMK